MNDPRTKIHCTCGPACRDPDTLVSMMEAGADVFRVNAALADAEEIGFWAGRVREAAARLGRHVGLLVDLPGPKFRVGPLAGGAPLSLAEGHELQVDAGGEPGDGNRVPLRSMPYFADVAPGAQVVLGDGVGRLEVLTADEGRLRLRALEALELREGLSIHFPGTSLPTAVPTRRDRDLLQAAVAAGADMVAQSWVRTEDDIGRLRGHLADLGAKDTLVLAKIERREAVEAIDRILPRADGLLLGRGDLGIDVGVEHVPPMQRRVIEAGRRAGCPVIVATEMLDSMIRNTRPTRAEASDVAGAVFEGADGVMLTGETALGAHPVLVVETMADILRAAENDPSAPYAGSPLFPPQPSRIGRPDQHVVQAAVGLARETGAAAIVVFSRRGSSAFRLSKERPAARIHAFAPTDEVCRRLSLAWGVRPQRLPDGRKTDEVLAFAREYLYGAGGLAPGDRAVLVMGGTGDPAGATTLIKLFTA